MHTTNRRLSFGFLIFASSIPNMAFAESAKKMPAMVEMKNKFKRPREIPQPKENLSTPARVLLGKTLFFDPRLSGSNFISCATCHNPAFSWGDGLAKGIGHGMKNLGRRSPTILNAAWIDPLMWDGRFANLEEQALGPITSEGEMNLPAEEIESKLRAIVEYAPLFEKAYPGEGVGTKPMAKAIAAYERTVVSGKAPFDLWIDGNKNAISKEAQNGFVLFNTKANCVSCHSGWRFTDDSFHDIGVETDDKGRGALPDFTSIETLQSAFKTPTLRNADRRGPFMHNGSEKSLLSVVELYNVGGRVKRPSLSGDIKPLNLTPGEMQDLVTFMTTLTSRDIPQSIPMLPR